VFFKRFLLLVFTIAFFIAVAIQIAFFAAFLIAFTRKKEKGNASEPVSIVICAHDEIDNLRELIPLLMEQDYPDFEIIIVNDRSNDETFDYLLQETRVNSRVRMVKIDNLPAHVNGKKYALTLGIKAAKYETILLTDADCRPATNQWIRTLAAELTTSATFVVGYSPYTVNPGFLNRFIRFEALVTAIQYVGLAILKKPYMGVGRNLAYRKSFFLEKKGFNHLLHITGGDDDLFVNQYATGLNTVAVSGTDALVYSIPKTTLKSYLRQKVRHLSVGKLYHFKDRLLLGLFVITWIASWFAGLPLLVASLYSTLVYYILGALVLRIIMLILTTHYASKNLGDKFEAWPVVVLDFLYSIYYISTGVITLLTKKVQWRN